MTEPSSYQLIKDIHKVTSSLEVKMNKRIDVIEEKQDKMEGKLNKMVGQATIGMVVISTTIGMGATLLGDWIKRMGK